MPRIPVVDDVLGPMHGPPLPEPGEPGWSIWPREVWPAQPLAAAPVRVVLAAAGAALAGTAVLHPGGYGIGYLLTGLLVFAAVYGTAGRASRPVEWAGISLTLALLTVPALLAAEWVNALAMLAAWIVGWATVAGAQTWAAVLGAPWLPAALPARVWGWTRLSVQRVELPGGRGDLRRPALVAAVTVGLLAVFGLLFAGADTAFAHTVGHLVPSLDVGGLISRGYVFALVGALVLFGAYLLRSAPRLELLVPRRDRPVARWEWAVPLAALDVLFAAFVAVQTAVLFGGHRHVLETAGLTYAEYARQGFWQLLAVSVLTMLVIAVTLAVAGRTAPDDRRWIRALIGTLCGLSVVIVASAVHRMWLYQQAYGFTELRLLVITVELWLGVVFALIAVAGIRMAGWWLPRAVLAAGALSLLGLAAVNPDRLIADRNIDHYLQTGNLDTAYLSRLSPDALPALDRLPEPLRGCVRARVAGAAGASPRAWQEFNLSWSRAAAEPVAPVPAGVCDVADRRAAP